MNKLYNDCGVMENVIFKFVHINNFRDVFSNDLVFDKILKHSSFNEKKNS